MYKCVPLKAVVKNSSYKSYDLIDGFTPEEREWFIEANNSELGSMPGEFADTWNQIFEDIQNDKKVVVSDKSDVEYLILKNMKRRFPILVQVKTMMTIIYGKLQMSIMHRPIKSNYRIIHIWKNCVINTGFYYI